MSISKELIDAVNNNDVVMARIILKNNMLLDPSFSLYEETSAYADKNIIDLFETHDGKMFTDDSSAWTKDYLDGLMADLMSNFSKERITHIRKVCGHIYGTTSRAQSRKDESSHSTPEVKRNINGNSDYRGTSNSKKIANHNTNIGVGLAIGGATAAVVGVVASKPLIVGAGVLAAVAGVIIAADK